MRALLLCLLLTTSLWAHFHTLIPDATRIRKGEQVSFRLFWGHPFEHVVMPSARPQTAFAVAPDGTQLDLSESFERDGAAWRFSFLAPGRGDYQIVLRFARVFVPEQELFFEDTVRMNIHVQVQQGWQQRLDGFDVVPLTRPYGLRAGAPFRFEVYSNGAPVPGLDVEVERYHERAPDPLPDEVFITGVERTDALGQCQAWLAEAGFWSVTAARETDRGAEQDGARYPVVERITYWLQVEP